jgi:nickel/cobalt exporter
MGLDTLSWNVLGAALGIAVVHTALGPDHTLPFVALARARGWSRGRTLLITALCGVGHTLSSIVLALVGALLGVSIGALDTVDQSRGELAAWVLAAFGAAYALWGLRHAWRQRAGVALHDHGGDTHLHVGGHHPHTHARPEGSGRAAFWPLFAVFVLGPCEPLIPLVFVPASQGRWLLAVGVAALFGLATVGTMLVLVGTAHAGLNLLPLRALERWSHFLAGAVVAASGTAILVNGL